MDELEHFQKIKKLQKSLLKNSSLERQKHLLKELQENLQNLSQIRPLTEKERQIQTKVRKNLSLIQNENSVDSLASLSPIINSIPQSSLSFIAAGDKETSSGNNSNSDLSPNFQKGLVILAIVSLILILIWQWYRKKKEKEPF